MNTKQTITLIISLVQNVIQWVKVDNHSVNFYWQIFRSVCVATVQEEVVNLGGPGRVSSYVLLCFITTQALSFLIGERGCIEFHRF